MAHPNVQHPRDLLATERRANDWAMSLLARIFGSPWTVYAFMTIPLVVEYWATAIQNVVFFFSSAWVQLFALPLFVFQSNKRDKQADAKADVDHAAMTSMHTTVDAVHQVNVTQDQRLARIEGALGVTTDR